MRVAASVALVAAIATGCAHRPSEVTRLVDGREVVGRFVPPEAWERALDRAVAERANPAATRELDAALEAGDLARASAIAATLVDSDDARVRERVGDALVRAGDAAALERFVAAHADEPAFAIAWNDRIVALAPELADAVARALAADPRYAIRGALALARADRIVEARASIAIATPTSIDDELLLAEVSLAVGDPARARDLARSAYARGASTRALALEARALDALGLREEAEALRVRVASASTDSRL